MDANRQTCDAPPASAATNRELVRSIRARWQRGDFSALEWADPEIEYVIADGPAPGAWAGLDGMAEAFRGVLSAYAAYYVEAEELWELDRNRVLVVHRYSGRGRTSGLELGDLASKGADVFHITAGRVTRLVLYWKGDHALSDLGLLRVQKHVGPPAPLRRVRPDRQEKPAASYSPRPLRAKYHRR